MRAIIDQRRTIFRDPHLYAAHPHAVATPQGWVAVFNIAPRRDVTMHPPEDPFYRNVVMRSSDQGQNWTIPQVVPDFAMSGTECGGLTVLSDGAILLNQWQFDWQPLGAARARANQAGIHWPADFLAGWLASPEHDVAHLRDVPPEQIAPWARCGGRLFISRSDDGGTSFRRGDPVSFAPFAGAYGMRGGVELQDGSVLMPFSDVPNYHAIFTLRSRDGGRTWGPPRLAVEVQGKDFEEPSILRPPSGRLLMCLRENVGRQLHLTRSDDGGESWSVPEPIPVRGYPGHLIALPGNLLLLTTGWRYGPDFGIRAHLSRDDGATWGEDLILADDLPTRNLGYPVTLPRGDAFSTIFYGEDDIDTTCIFQTDWRLSP